MGAAAHIRLLKARYWFWRHKYDYRHKKRLEYSAKVARNKKHFPSHKDALRKAEAGEHKWGALEGEAAKEVHRYADVLHKLQPPSPVPAGEGSFVPQTWWNPYRRRVANWIARELYDAVEHFGAQGHVNSGERSRAEQEHLYWLYKHGGNVAAPPGYSNHEGNNYHDVKSGAVDWESAESLAAALRRKRAAGKDTKLLWAMEHGLYDHPHFSKNGH